MEHVPRGLRTSSNVDIMLFCPHSSPGRWRDRRQSQPQGRTGSRTGSLEPLAPSPRPPTLPSARDGGCLRWDPLPSPRLSGPRRSSTAPGSLLFLGGPSRPHLLSQAHRPGAALRGEEPPFPAPKPLSTASSATLHLPSPQEGSRGSVGLTVVPRSMWLLG